MYTEEELLAMLSSDKPPVRYDACERIRTSSESSPRIIDALLKTTHDTNGEVAGRAQAALKADVHHQMAIKMGIEIPVMYYPDFDGSRSKEIYSEALRKDKSNIKRKYSISPETHVKLQQLMPIFAFFFIPLLCIITSGIMSQSILPLILVVSFILVILAIPYLPVKCNKLGCNGRMNVTRERISSSKVNLFYQCKKCGGIYDVDIFSLQGHGH